MPRRRQGREKEEGESKKRSFGRLLLSRTDVSYRSDPYSIACLPMSILQFCTPTKKRKGRKKKKRPLLDCLFPHSHSPPYSTVLFCCCCCCGSLTMFVRQIPYLTKNKQRIVFKELHVGVRYKVKALSPSCCHMTNTNVNSGFKKKKTKKNRTLSPNRRWSQVE